MIHRYAFVLLLFVVWAPLHEVIGQSITSALTKLDSTPQTSANNPQQGSMRFRTHTVVDRETNLSAATLLVPSNWDVEGGIRWTPHNAQVASLVTAIRSPDQDFGLTTLPLERFCYGDFVLQFKRVGEYYQQKEVAAPSLSVESFIEEVILRRYVTDVAAYQITQRQELPNIAAKLAAINTGHGVTAKTIAARIRFEFVKQGRAFEQDFYVCLLYSTASNDFVIWYPAFAYACHAPKGQLDEWTPMLNTIMTSSKYGPEFELLVEKLQWQQVQGNFNEIAFARQWADQVSQFYSQYRESIMQAYWQRQRVREDLNRQFSDYIKDIQRFQTSTGEVQLPSHYQHAWQSSGGEIVMTNDPTANPNYHSTQTWNQLTPVR